MRLGRVFFRADASSEIGMGHLVRSLALAEMLGRDFFKVFIIKSPSPQVKSQILSVCEEVIEVREEEYSSEIEELCSNYFSKDDIVVLDGYNFDTNYQRKVKEKGCSLVCIDDVHNYHFVADAVINHSPHVSKEAYSLEEYSKLYLGLEYALLRQPFLKAAKKNSPLPPTNNVFVCFGGSDYYNLTEKVLDTLTESDHIGTINGVVGANYQHLKQLLSKNYGENVKVHQNLSAEEMCRIMSQSSLAVIPSSSILWEAMAVGVPTIITGYYVDNQKDISNFFNSYSESVYSIGDFLNVSLESLKSQIENSLQEVKVPTKKLVDGQADIRLKKIFAKLLLKNLHLKKALSSDAKLYYEWANDPDVRANAINKKPITWDNHVKWFEKKVDSVDSLLFIGYVGCTPAGQVRFDRTNDSYLISYSIDKNWRGLGLGTKILEEAIHKLRQEKGNIKLIAEVFDFNKASVKVFEKLNFKPATQESKLADLKIFINE